MSDYAKLVAAWNSSTQPPVGVAGTALTSGMTTQQKLDAVNHWVQTGPPIPMIIPTYRIYNLIVPSEYTALPSSQQEMCRDILFMGEVDVSSGTHIRNRVIAVFPSSTQTFGNLATMASNYDTPKYDWCFFNNYPTLGSTGPGNLTMPDANNAGLV